MEKLYHEALTNLDDPFPMQKQVNDHRPRKRDGKPFMDGDTRQPGLHRYQKCRENSGINDKISPIHAFIIKAGDLYLVEKILIIRDPSIRDS